MLKVEKDFEEFVELLNKFNVDYMIVGAYEQRTDNCEVKS